MIDTTPDFRAQALREKLVRLDAVHFTHSHADHILGLDDVRSFYFRQKKPIPIYADAHCMKEIHRTFNYIFNADYPYGGVARLDPHLIDGPFEVDGLKVLPVPVLHGNLPILGFRIDGVAYLTDVSEIPESVGFVRGSAPIRLRTAIFFEYYRVFKERSALVERARDFRRLDHARRLRRARQAGREYSLRTGRGAVPK